MEKRKVLTSLAATLIAASSLMAADNGGGISAEMLSRLEATFENSPSDKALRNALNATSIDKLAANA